MAFVMSFADLPAMLQEFTNDVQRLTDALRLVDRGRYTRLFDSVIVASNQFRGHQGRRALIVLTDGHDANSDANLAAAIEAAQRADVAIYPVAVDVTPRFFYERWILERLARATGGRVSYLETRDNPERIYAAIAEDLREQYRISYEPTRPGGGGEWRPIEVRLVQVDSKQRGRVRSRPGYFAE